MTSHATSLHPASGESRIGRIVGPDHDLIEVSRESLHRLVAERLRRLERLLAMHAPDIVVGNEMRMVGAAVHALFEQGAMVHCGSITDVLPRTQESGVSLERNH